ncbi:uncharacterized protein LOC119683668 [Teleopsis dalmanni]|uniref:uncharacterized protein LOC119674989 n=1 Tax=Teleopsis dalmanni TaxID=139649 RepID=UPI0018CF4258|nr:uncharacterized protein LOC119674989 [Teleopsis dalmanni]XP_037953401.1 uncharacterized protein LOC119683668 [Teleopsis dalmanni]
MTTFANKLSTMNAIERDFENFFSYCTKQGFSTTQMLDICQPLFQQQRKVKTKRFLFLTTLVLIVYCFYNWCDSCAWFLSAIGRLLLIQLLPYWNWAPLYNGKCLIERPFQETTTNSLPRLGRHETDVDNCALCEMLDSIPTTSNTTFSYMEAKYLERGLPVIITDSHDEQTLDWLLEKIQNNPQDFLSSDPCDIGTNLMLKKFFNLDVAIQKIKSNNSMTKWFLQFRNCKFNAVKASRMFVTRPYYYPLHLEPFYSSWILISQDYVSANREIYLQGLIFVQQLSGFFEFHLRPKQPCGFSCPTIDIRLSAGECLVFSTDLWVFSYEMLESKNNSISIATILEIDWHL